MSEAGFDLAGDLGERGLVLHREVGEHLAVDLDVRPLEAGHERAVAHSQLAHRGVDARDPQRAHGALLRPAVAVGVLPRLHHRLLGYAIDVAAAAAETLRLGEHLLVARARRDSTLDSWHGALLRRVRQHRADGGRVGAVHGAPATQLALRLGALLGQDVALERAAALDAAAAAHAETLRRAPLRFHLGHCCSLLFSYDAGRPPRTRGRFKMPRPSLV